MSRTIRNQPRERHARRERLDRTRDTVARLRLLRAIDAEIREIRRNRND